MPCSMLHPGTASALIDSISGWTIARGRLSGEASRDPRDLIPQRSIDERVVSEAGIDVALDHHPCVAESPENPLARGLRKQDVVTTFQYQHRAAPEPDAVPLPDDLQTSGFVR